MQQGMTAVEALKSVFGDDFLKAMDAVTGRTPSQLPASRSISNLGSLNLGVYKVDQERDSSSDAHSNSPSRIQQGVHMTNIRTLSVLLTLACGVMASATATVSATYTPVDDRSWAINLTLNLLDWSREDPTVSGFTIQFDPEALVQLSLAGSPQGWDSIVLQPDPALPAGGVLDSLAFDPAYAIAPGMQAAGFSLIARFAVESPASLPPTFWFYDASGATVSNGIVDVSVVPEPSTVLAFLGGLAVISGTRRDRGFKNKRT